MSTYGSVEYILVTGTPGAAFDAAVEAQVNLGYAIIDNGPQTNGTDLWQVMIKGAAASFIADYAITAVATGAAGAGTFTVAGDQTANFNPGFKFTITGSTANDGVWTVVSSAYSTSTVITVKEAVTDGTVDGTIISYAPSVGP